MNRFSVLYTINGQYHHIGCASQSEALSILQKLAANSHRTAVGIYDAKTELFEWEPGLQHNYNQAGIQEQGELATQIITVAQALRRRDASWQPAGTFRRPSFFA